MIRLQRNSNKAFSLGYYRAYFFGSRGWRSRIRGRVFASELINESWSKDF